MKSHSEKSIQRMTKFMKILVTYSSLTGNTKKLAEGIYNGIGDYEKDILPMKDVKSLDEYDTVIAGYWVDKGGANKEAAEFLKTIKGKKVGIFATLAFWPDSDHGAKSIKAGADLVSENNHVIGRFICQGKISESILKKFESLPEDNPHYITPEKKKRHKISASHPSQLDIDYAAALFKESLDADV